MTYTLGQTVYAVVPGERYDHALQQYVPWAYVHPYRYSHGDGQTLALTTLFHIHSNNRVERGLTEYHAADRVFGTEGEAERCAEGMRTNEKARTT